MIHHPRQEMQSHCKNFWASDNRVPRPTPPAILEGWLFGSTLALALCMADHHYPKQGQTVFPQKSMTVSIRQGRFSGPTWQSVVRANHLLSLVEFSCLWVVQPTHWLLVILDHQSHFSGAMKIHSCIGYFPLESTLACYGNVEICHTAELPHLVPRAQGVQNGSLRPRHEFGTSRTKAWC